MCLGLSLNYCKRKMIRHSQTDNAIAAEDRGQHSRQIWAPGRLREHICKLVPAAAAAQSEATGDTNDETTATATARVSSAKHDGTTAAAAAEGNLIWCALTHRHSRQTLPACLCVLGALPTSPFPSAATSNLSTFCCCYLMSPPKSTLCTGRNHLSNGK